MSMDLILKCAYPVVGFEPDKGDWRMVAWNKAFEEFVQDIPTTGCRLSQWINDTGVEWIGQMLDGGSPITHWDKKWIMAERVEHEGEVVLLIRNITDHVRLEDAYKAIEARLRTTQQLAMIGDWENDLEKGIEHWSDELYKLLGYSDHFIRPNVDTFMRFVHPDDVERLMDIHKNAFRGEPYDVEFRIINARKEVRWMYTRARAVLNAEGELVRIHGLMQDITERKHLEEELKEALEKAAQASQDKSHFLATMSHEIRTPVHGILGMTELIEKQRPSEEILECTEDLRISANNLLEIINEVIELTKIEQGNLNPEIQPIDLHAMLNNIIRTYRFKAEQKGIVLEQYIDPKLPSIVLTDGLKLQQILVNLIGNAVKFTRKGKVQLSTEVVEEDTNTLNVKFRVQDTGIGIDEEKIDTIFETYQQADASIAKHYGGTGLGLSIARQYADVLHGDLQAKSRLGEGSTFTFSLSVERHEPLGNRTQNQVEFDGVQLSVLVVEDNMINQAFIRGLLEKVYGFETEIVSRGEDALDALLDQKWDCILMDDRLPGMSGVEATEMIRRNDAYKEVPIIGLSSEARFEEHESYLEAGMNTVVRKPITERKLYDVFREIIDTGDYQRVKPVKREAHFYRYINEGLIEDRIQHMGQRTVQNVVSYAIEEYQQRAESIERAIEHKDFDQMKVDFNALKGNVDYFGSEEINEGVRLIESAFSLGEHDGLEVIVRDFLEEFKVFTEDLMTLRESLQKS